MRSSLLFLAVAVTTACIGFMVQIHIQERAAQAEVDAVMRPFEALKAKHRREMDDFIARENARIKGERERIAAIVEPVQTKLKLAQMLYDRDAKELGEDEARRRHQAGVYLRAAFDE